ncbi:MAG: signal peptidase I, partial [Bdellovibrionales bacterium]|nr:signal peptidase I [Bdellovibrionales bacterium]
PSSTANEPKSSTANEIISFVKTICVLFVIAMLLRGSVVEAFKIPSGSMLSTLQIGDHILVSKLSYGFRLPFVKKTLWRFDSPERGDVVVFTRVDDPSTKEDESKDNIIKRVIGTPGDTVEVRAPYVYINGVRLDEPYARWVGPNPFGGNFGPVTVPTGKVLLLGDNRNHSKDSRFWHDPFLPLDNIKGRALIVYFSWADMKRMGNIIR